MAGKRKAPLWRQAFLRALKRTGNVRASAFEAGVDPGTAYDHRAKDAGFRAQWAAAKTKHAAQKTPRPLHHASHGPPPHRHDGKELVLRRTKHGDKLVRASPGGWSQRIEESFLDGLEQTGCVRTAARAAGLSVNAFYKRRDNYPEFAARWEERVARFGERLPGLLAAAAVQSMSPQPEGARRRGRARLPAMSVDQSLRLHAINENTKARGRGRRGGERNLLRKREQSEEELIETGVKLLGMMKRRREKARLAEGWTDAGNGIWLPPGWTVQRPEAPPSPEASVGTPPSPEERGDGR